MRRLVPTLPIPLILCLAVAPVAAAVWNVPLDAPTIAAGIDSAAAGDTVLVACGTYAESGLTMKPGVVLRSETGLPDCVAIDASYTARIMSLTGADSTTVIEGITFARGSTGSVYPGDAGSALRLENASPRIRDCRFVDNQTSSDATVYCWVSSAPVFERCEFSANVSFHSVGALYLIDSPGAVVIDCDFVGNACDSTVGYGGACMLWNATADFTGCRFSGNTARSAGAVRVSNVSAATFTDCVFDDNRGSGNGGCLMIDSASADLVSCTIAGNDSPSGNGCVRIENATVNLQGTILAFAGPGPSVSCAGTSSVTAACTDVYGNVGGDWVDCLAGLDGTNGNLAADPRFCQLAAGDLTLRDGSPCLDAPGCGRIGALGLGCSRTLAVPSQFATIQAAIDAAAVGDTVEVACGTFTWTGEGSGDADGLVHLKSGLTFRSETRLPGCVTIDAESNGRVLHLAPGTGTTSIEGFTFTGGAAVANGGGMYVTGNPDSVAISSCDFAGNSVSSQGGGLYSLDSDLSVQLCTFSGNSTPTYVGPVGGAIAFQTGHLDLTACAVTDNVGSNGAGLFTNSASLTASDCVFSGNSSGYNGGGAFVQHTSGDFLDCVFSENSTVGLGGGVCVWENPTPSFDGCTFWGNRTTSFDVAAGIQVRGVATTIHVTHTVIAASTQGVAVHCLFSGSGATLDCCDIWGNANGDWVGCLSGQLGVNGNVSEDPRFCDPEGGDFTVSTASPCLIGPCGVIGTFGLGCLDPLPVLADVTDIGEDQGGQVRLRWTRSLHDAPGDSLNLTGYEIYRRQDARGATAGRVGLASAALDPPAGRDLRLDGWDYLLTVPVHGDSIYQVVAPTLCDSTIADGMCWSAFFVRAATDDPYDFLDSPPDSGYSVDNLAPSVPTSLQLAGTQLAWDECPDGDFDYFTVYGADTESLEGAALLGHTVDPALDVAADRWPWYLVTATDFSGNESAFASAQDPAIDAPPTRFLPGVYALRTPRPNPSSRGTAIEYDVPRAGSSSLRIYDVRGRLVRIVVERTDAPGRYAPVWDGRDESGRAVAPGVYFVRYRAEGFVATERLIRMR